METIFHPSSFGYRPGKSAHDALAQCQGNCNTHDWVIDIDIKGFFDTISHAILLRLLENHTQEKWVLMYVDRWLRAGVEQDDGSVATSVKGTPQGGVISPLLANVYLHHCFDLWMQERYPQCPFERYADDIVIHSRSQEESEQVLAQLRQRIEEFSLTLHPEKTKIVYCKNYRRKEKHDNESFTFLSYSFQPRTIRSKFGTGKRLVVFNAAISQQAKTSIKAKLREILRTRWSDKTLTWFAEQLNPKVRGWVNYYAKFNRGATYQIFYYLNALIRSWIRNTYKIVGKDRLYTKYREVQATYPEMFYHWKLGIRG